MATMAENVIVADSETRLPMLKKGILNRQRSLKIQAKITVKDTDGVTDIRRPQRLKDLAGEDKLCYDSDIKAVNILLLGLPVDIYTLINHYQTTKEIWDRVKELMECTEMTKQECESMLYDELDKFTSELEESIQSYYLRYAKLINDMNMIPMSMTPMQINTKFVNHLQPEWSSYKLSKNFKADHVDAYDLDCDDEATTNAIFMEILSSVGSLNDDTVGPRYDFNMLSAVPYYDTRHDSDMLNSNVQELGYIENIIVEIVIWYLDSGCSKHMTGHRDKLINFVSMFIGTVRFGNDHYATIMGYGDLQMGNILISHVYCVEGLCHNLFFVRQFCDSFLEVAFRKHTCFVQNLKGVDLLSSSHGFNLYTISMADMMKSYPIFLISKASKTKSWLWNRRLSHLNFGTINQLAKLSLVKGLPNLKYTKDHLCSACQMGKSKKESHPHKPKPSTNEKLQMLHMNLCRPMRVESINKKIYILVIVDDYSRFTWVKFLRTKDEAPEIIIKFLKQA
nr:retrovirus-related Pol polyprotein from transposon TNT 1-94 [Tanacetum cinerariifolium]